MIGSEFFDRKKFLPFLLTALWNTIFENTSPQREMCVFNCFLKILESVICDALRDLVPFVQFEKAEEEPWKSVTFRKVAGFSQQF